MKHFTMALMLALGALHLQAAEVTVTVTNNERTQRQELAEVKAADVYQRLGIGYGQPIVVKNGLGQQVAYQLTYDGMILIDAAVRPCGDAVFTIQSGQSEASKTPVPRARG